MTDTARHNTTALCTCERVECTAAEQVQLVPAADTPCVECGGSMSTVETLTD